MIYVNVVVFMFVWVKIVCVYVRLFFNINLTFAELWRIRCCFYFLLREYKPYDSNSGEFDWKLFNFAVLLS